MHLLTFLTYTNPGIFMRTMILGAQGGECRRLKEPHRDDDLTMHARSPQKVFYNAFFLAYLIAPRIAHRFVGALEEEAVLTYSESTSHTLPLTLKPANAFSHRAPANIVSDVKEGRLPEWEQLPACQIARDYWKMPEISNMLDILLAVRADESSHRFIHHSLGSLDQRNDFNPFANQMPSPKLRGQVAGLTREQAVEWAAKAEEEAKHLQESGPHMATQSRGSSQQTQSASQH